MSAWVAVGLVLEVVAALCLVLGVRMGALTSSAPDRFSAPLPPLGALALYALGFGLAGGGLTSLREDLGWAGVGLAVATLALSAGALRLLWPRRRRAAAEGFNARRLAPDRPEMPDADKAGR